MELWDCRELFVEFPVDAARAQAGLPSGYQVKPRDGGKAVLLLMVQDCTRGRLDRILPIEPLRFAHVWIEVTGPEEVGPVLGGTLRSLPTAYYYATPHQVESRMGHLALSAVGIASQRVDSISLGGGPGPARKGEVVESPGRGGYRWTDAGRPWAEGQYVTGRRRFGRDIGGLWPRRTSGTVECRSNFLGQSQVALEADPDSAIGRLQLGGVLRGEGYLVEMTDCRAVIAVKAR
jgi:hypothetical protein